MQLGVIGAGNMATAIIHGIIKGGLLKPDQMGVYDINPERVKDFSDLGLSGFDSPGALAANSEYLLLSVKPQNFEELLTSIRSDIPSDTVIISIAAGISHEYISGLLGRPAKVVQVMPNTPLLVGKGSTAMSFVPPTTQQEFSYVAELFGCAGAVECIDSTLMNEVIPLNGSSPAYIYRFAQVFCDRALELGFDRDAANRLFAHTLIGAAAMMLETDKDHQSLIDMVTSPGGATFEGLKAMEKHDFKKAMIDTYDATVKRAYELGK